MEISNIKNQLPLLEVLHHYGYKPDKNKRLCCPFHPDKTPSMQVYPETGTVYCFSSNCKLQGKALDQIDFIMHKEQCNKHEALLKAKKLIGETIIQTLEEKHKPMTNLNETFHKLQQALPRSKNAIEYLKSRAIYDLKLETGFNNYNSGYKELQNCVVFPLKDREGTIVSLYGRSISLKSQQRHYYLKDRKGLYPGYPAAETYTIILTESVIDAATIMKFTGYPTLALYGTNCLTEEHSEALSQSKELKEIILFMDGDEAGKAATKKLSEQLAFINKVWKISSVATPEGEGPNSLVQSHNPQILSHLIENRTFLFSNENPLNEMEITLENPSISNLSNKALNTKNPDYITFQKENVLISILGGIALYPLDRLRVTLKLERIGSNNPMHQIRQNLDLYQDEFIEKFARKAAERLELGSTALLSTLMELTELIEEDRLTQIEARKTKKPEKRILSPQRLEKAIAFLKSADLLTRTNKLIGESGVTGEEINRLLMYLVFTSRLREQPLHIISLGASGTGKTYLQEKIAELIPEEGKIEITALSENAFYYFDKKELKNKLVLIEDLDGASDDKVLFAIRELQSKRRISKTVPLKDSKGNLKTVTLEVEGPISLAGTTTREKLYEDNANSLNNS